MVRSPWTIQYFIAFLFLFFFLYFFFWNSFNILLNYLISLSKSLKCIFESFFLFLSHNQKKPWCMVVYQFDEGWDCSLVHNNQQRPKEGERIFHLTNILFPSCIGQTDSLLNKVIHKSERINHKNNNHTNNSNNRVL